METEDNYVLHNESSVQEYLQLDPHSFQRRSNAGQTSLLQRSFAGHGSFHGSFLDSYMAQAGIGDRSSADISGKVLNKRIKLSRVISRSIQYAVVNENVCKGHQI